MQHATYENSSSSVLHALSVPPLVPSLACAATFALSRIAIKRCGMLDESGCVELAFCSPFLEAVQSCNRLIAERSVASPSCSAARAWGRHSQRQVRQHLHGAVGTSSRCARYHLHTCGCERTKDAQGTPCLRARIAQRPCAC